MLSASVREALGDVLPLLGIEPDALMSNWGRVTQAHGWAMANAQLFELAVRMASAATRDDLIDEGAADVVHQDLHRRLGRAISQLGNAWPDDLEVPHSLMGDLDEARVRRNHLSHDFWILQVGRLMHDADTVIRELEDDAARFEALAMQLIDTVYARALSERGLPAEHFTGFVQFLIAALVSMPDELADTPLIGEAEGLIERLEGVRSAVLARLDTPEGPQS